MSSVLDAANRVWTSADLAELPDGLHWRRVEIVDGILVVSPQPTPQHGYVVDELTGALRATCPIGLHVTGSAGIDYGRTYRVPDVSVVDLTAYTERRSRIMPSDVLLAVEVELPSSVTTDRITKTTEYALAGIPHYWRVELDPLRLLVHRLAADAYELAGSWGGGESVRIIEPFPVEIDLRRLLPG